MFLKIPAGDGPGADGCSRILAVRGMRPVLLSLCCLLLASLSCGAQQKPAKKNTDQSRASGAELYKRYCSVCYGNDGKGNGPPPRSSPFSAAPPDLTTLSQRHEGKFPDAYVSDVLRDGAKLPDHGSSEMPVWGEAFKTAGSDDAQVLVRIRDLTNYIMSLRVN
jgi:mono/diheme cytochrome c family protein